jgi:hypothetical protein
MCRYDVLRPENVFLLIFKFEPYLHCRNLDTPSKIASSQFLHNPGPLTTAHRVRNTILATDGGMLYYQVLYKLEVRLLPKGLHSLIEHFFLERTEC